jgi:predicted ATPase
MFDLLKEQKEQMKRLDLATGIGKDALTKAVHKRARWYFLQRKTQIKAKDNL